MTADSTDHRLVQPVRHAARPVDHVQRARAAAVRESYALIALGAVVAMTGAAVLGLVVAVLLGVEPL